MKRLASAEVSSPLFSFWFDDGFSGVLKNAAPILAEHGVSGAMSICSRFNRREEIFWRSKLSYLHSIDAGRHLRARLRTLGYSLPTGVRDFTMDNFGPEILQIIDTLFDQAVPLAIQNDAFRIFETPDGIRDLYHHGWVIANHSAAHYPIGQNHVCHMLLDQFDECEKWISDVIGQNSDYWVIPFDVRTDVMAISTIREKRSEKTIVRVGDLANSSVTFLDGRVLYRIGTPTIDRHKLQMSLYRTSQRTLEGGVGHAG